MAEPNPVAEITVQYINPPKPGKKMGSIKSSEGDYYGCFPAQLHQFFVGEVCKLEYKQSESGYKSVVKKIGTTPLNPVPMRARTAPADSEQIAVLAMVKSFIEAGKVELERSDLIACLETCKAAYRSVFRSPEIQTTQDELKDEIPY